jgi:hypothetical protein
MAENCPRLRERGDDLPLVLAPRQGREGPRRRDEHVATPGHGAGLGWGGTVLWLTHSLSEADQWRHHVAPGAEPRLHTRRGGTGPRLHPLDLSDARWSAVLEALREDERWPACEGALT